MHKFKVTREDVIMNFIKYAARNFYAMVILFDCLFLMFNGVAYDIGYVIAKHYKEAFSFIPEPYLTIGTFVVLVLALFSLMYDVSCKDEEDKGNCDKYIKYVNPGE